MAVVEFGALVPELRERSLKMADPAQQPLFREDLQHLAERLRVTDGPLDLGICAGAVQKRYHLFHESVGGESLHGSVRRAQEEQFVAFSLYDNAFPQAGAPIRHVFLRARVRRKRLTRAHCQLPAEFEAVTAPTRRLVSSSFTMTGRLLMAAPLVRGFHTVFSTS
ncbi:hypothetical protein ACIBQ1_15905 [Nonomuraea sp. NPDC050153]|uniref:hypothetical protein n=1 Tax=Nonomuraea sp. NPDC050153 TaxID=3364359 RepID=UPI00378B88E6